MNSSHRTQVDSDNDNRTYIYFNFTTTANITTKCIYIICIAHYIICKNSIVRHLISVMFTSIKLNNSLFPMKFNSATEPPFTITETEHQNDVSFATSQNE